jgi:hypothetical protein
MLLAHVVEGKVRQAMDLVVHGAGDANAAGSGERLQPRRDVDSGAVNVVALEDDLAEVDADAKLEAPVARHAAVACRHRVLDLDAASNRISDARELRQPSVTRGLDDPSAKPLRLRVDDLAAHGLQPLQRAGFIAFHQPRVADQVGNDDGRQPTRQLLSAHLASRRPAMERG